MIKNMTKNITLTFFLACCILFPVHAMGQGLLRNAQTSQGFTRPGVNPVQRTAAQPIVPQSAGTAGTAGTAAAVSGENWRALLFAVEQYNEDTQNLLPLRGCYNDMVAVQTDWLRRIGVRENHITFLNDRNPSAMPTRQNFMDRLAHLCRTADPSTTLVVVIASHGIAMDGKSYICPIDVTWQPTGQVWDNLIAISDVVDLLRSSRASRKLLIIDACRSVGDAAGGDFMNEFATLAQEMASGSASGLAGLAIITSCSLAQEAHEKFVNGQPRGVFMTYFLEGLSGPADYMGVIDGNITLSEAYAYAFSQTSRFVFLHRNGQQQTPELLRDNHLTAFTLAQSEPMQRQTNETDMQFLLRASMELATRGAFSVATDVLTHIITNEPNNKIAVACRAGTFLSVSDFPRAMADFTNLGRTLDLYLQFSDADNRNFQAEINRLATAAEREAHALQNRRIRIMTDRNAESRVVAELQPGQKVSISQIDGLWYYVARIDDNITQDGVGWVHKDNLTWTPDRVEQYRPQTNIHVPVGSRADMIGGLNFRQQAGPADGGSGAAVMQRVPGRGSM